MVVICLAFKRWLDNTIPYKMNYFYQTASRWVSAAVCSLLALCMLASTVHGQDFSGKTINSISIRYAGSKNVDEARVRNMMSVKTGQKYSAEKLDDDIRSLVESGLIDDVRILAEEQGNGVGLTFVVETKPRLAGVGFEGNVALQDKEKMAEATKIKVGVPLSDAAIFEARKNLQEYYQGYGYPEVAIDHRLQKTDRAGYADLIFVIQEGSKNEVRKIRFEGNNAFPDHKLENQMKTKEKGLLSFLTKSGRIDLDQLAEDEEAVLEFYRDNGYLRVRSTGFQRVPVKGGRVDLVMTINEGARYTVNSVGFGKMSVFTAEEMGKVLTLNTGDSYSSKKMRQDITTIRSYYGSRGYADAEVNPDIRNAGPNSVNIIYRVIEGSRYKVGRVTIEGNNVTKDKVIRREIPLKPGDNFNTVDLETTRKRLRGLNYFNNVYAEGEPSGQKGYRDINVLVNEKKTGSVQFGLGFSSIDSIVGYINLEQTNFDITDPWSFTGGGQRFGMNLRLGTERRDFKISLVEPWFLGQRLSLGGELFYRDQLYLSDEYDQRDFGGAVFLRKPLSSKSYVRGEYRLQKIRIDVEDDVAPTSVFQEFDGDYVRSSLGLTYVYDSRDAQVTPRSGHKFEAGLDVAGQFLGGDVDTITLNIEGSKHWNLWFDSILTLRGRASVVESDGVTPIFDRQFLGGARDLRGFEYRDIGPRDTGVGNTNEVYGGDTAAYATVEWSFPIVETVRGAIFYDTGFVNEDSWDFGPDDLYSDAGVGLRLNIPAIGPLALDYAVPVSSPDDESDQGGQFNFYLDFAF